MVTKQQILDSMRHIIDPDLGQDIVALDLIKNLTIDGRTVRFTVELAMPANPVKEKLRESCVKAVTALPGVEAAKVKLRAMLPGKRAVPLGSALENISTILMVSSVTEGVGKSTVAAHLALALRAQGLEVGLLGADIYGASIPRLFNVRQPAISMSNNLITPVELSGLKVLALDFLFGDSPAVLQGPIVSRYTQQILSQTAWGRLDYLIIDMPPGTGDIQLTIVQQAAPDGAVIVTNPQRLSPDNVTETVLMFEKEKVPVLGLIENMAYCICSYCHKKHYLCSTSTQNLQDRFGLAALAELPFHEGLSSARNVDEKTPGPAIREMAENIQRQVSKHRAKRPALPMANPGPQALRIHWPDGSIDVLPNKKLRASCRCPRCVDELTGEPLLDPSSIPDDIAVDSLLRLGDYALGVAWSDGHRTAIYPWDRLRELAAHVPSRPG